MAFAGRRDKPVGRRYPPRATGPASGGNSESRSVMKQIVQSARSGKLKITDVPTPQLRAGHLLVATRASLISAGTERMVVDFARKSLAGKARSRPDLVRKTLDKARRDGIAATFRAVLARLDEPLPLGYSAAGEIVAIGAGLEGAFRIGQRVAVAGAGLANHAELNLIPRSLAAPIPDDVGDEAACFATLAAIAMHAARNLQIWNLAEAGAAQAAGWLSAGQGSDAVLVAAASESSEPLELAAEIARDRARLCVVGKTGTEFPYAAFMKKEIELVVSRSYGPGRYDEDFEQRGVKYPVGFVRWTESDNLREAVRLMSPSLKQRLDVGALISHRFPFARAEEAYALVVGNTEPHLGVVLEYDAVARPLPRVLPSARPAVSGACVLGVIGAGSFARAVLLPALVKRKDVTLRTIVTQRGLTAEHAKTQFGFAACATEIDAVLGDPGINAVLIATRHGSHADLTARALASGKSVFVEKPLAIDRAGVDSVLAAREGSSGFFMVGFNRRFAPMVARARAHLARHRGAKFLVLRVNAGALPAESWINDAAEGGGRILGELCHFVDLARFLVDADIVSVQAGAGAVTAGICDDLAATLHFADGSLATIVYTALGDAENHRSMRPNWSSRAWRPSQCSTACARAGG